MKYKLINSVSKKETICDKVTIDGFDYYVSNLHAVSGDFALYAGHITKKLVDTEWTTGDRKVIATNNPNIDIPKVVDIIQQLASDVANNSPSLTEDRDKLICFTGWIDGYLKSKETYSLSEKDVIEFKNWWLKLNIEWVDNIDGKDIYKFKNGEKVTDQELLQIWKEQRPKIVYYE